MALGTRELLLILRARDEATRTLSLVANKLADINETTRLAAQRQIAAGAAMTSIGVGIIGVGAAMAMALKDATDEAATYEKAIALVSTQTDNVISSQKELSDIVQNTAKKIAVPIEQLSAGLYDIFSSMDVSVDGSRILLENLAKSAVAGVTDLETAGRATIAIMNAWKMPAEEVTKVLDVQFKLVQKGVGTYEQFAGAIGKAVPSAQRAGQSVETLAGMMAYLTRNGLSADMAAASAGRAFDALANPKVVGRLEKMGVEVRDANGGFKDMASIMSDLQVKLAGLTDPERADALQDLFKGAGGTIQARRFYDLVLKDAEAASMFTGLVGEMVDSSGEFTKAYDTMAGTAASKSQVLKNNWDVMKIQIGTALLPALKSFTDMLIKLFDHWNGLSDSTKETIAKCLAFAAALTIIVGVAVTLVGLWALLSGAALLLGVSVGALVGIVGAVAAIIVGLIAVGYLLWKNWDVVSAAIVKAWDWVLEKLMVVYNWIKETIGDKVVALFNKVKSDVMGAIGPMADFVVEMWKKISDWAEKTWPAIREFIQPFIDWWMAIWPEVKSILETVLHIIVDAFKIAWDIIVAVLKAAWEIIKGLVMGIWDIFAGLIDLIIGVFTGDWSRAWDGILSILKGVWEIIWGVLKGAWELIKGLFFAGIDIIKSTWENGLRFIGDVAEIIWDTIKTAVSNFWNWIKEVFSDGVRALGAIWGGIGDVMKATINWVIEHVYNNGIVSFWNKVAELTGLGKLEPARLIGQVPTGGGGQPMRAMAKGGVLGGYSPGVDNMLVAMSGGEGVLVPEAVRGLGAGFVYWANNFFSKGRTGAGGGQGGGLPGFANGGIVDTVMSLAGGIGNNISALFKDPIGFITNKIGNNPFVKGISTMAKKAIDGAVDKVWSWLSSFGGGDATASGAAIPAGSPFGWQAMFAIIKSQFAGATMNSGFRPGDPGYHGKGRAVDIGGPMGAINAWIASHFPFSTQLIYTPGANILNGRPFTYDAPTRADHFDHVHWAMDSGGVLKRGWNPPIFNGTGKPEAVLTSEQWSTVDKAIAQAEGRGSMGAGVGAGATITVNNYDISIVIHTQEIDPRANGLELGRKIAEGV